MKERYMQSSGRQHRGLRALHGLRLFLKFGQDDHALLEKRILGVEPLAYLCVD